MRLTLSGNSILPNGAMISTVDYSIAGPTRTSGSVDVSAGQSIGFVVGDLLAGNGYTIVLSATDSAGDNCSSASTPFSVQASKTTPVALDLVCYVLSEASVAEGGAEGSCLQTCSPADATASDSAAVSDVPGSVDAATADTGAPDAMACADRIHCNTFVNVNGSSFLLTDQGVCTATELTLYAKAVSGQATGACLACAAMAGCLDDSFDASDSLHECEDADATTDAGAAGVSQCLETLACDLGVSGSCGAFASSSAPSQGTVSNSYCGAGVTTANCTASPIATDAGTGPQGACVTPETAGFPSMFTPAEVLGAFETQAQPSGLANRLVDCLNTHCGAQCFP